MLHNLNIKVIGEIDHNQEYYDLRMRSLHSQMDRVLSEAQIYVHIRGDINFEYNTVTDQFRFVGSKTNLDPRLRRAIELDYELNRMFFKK